MKKLLIAAIILGAATTSYSQTDEGDFLVGGSFGFRTNKNDSRFNLSPNAGYFFADNFVGGANIILDFSNQSNVKSTQIEIGPFVRYYLGKTNVRPFLVSSFGFASKTDKTLNSKLSRNGYYFLAGLGYAAFISNDVAIEGIAGYNYTKYKNASSSNGFSLNFGFQVYINKGKMSELKRGKIE